MTTNTSATDNNEPCHASVDETDATARYRTIHHDGVMIAMSRAGRGRPLVLCPGLLSTQADLQALTGLLRRDFDVATFDLRGHGRSSPADRYRFASFRDDLAAVIAELERLGLSSPPVLVGHSLGADLAVHYASEHPDSVAGLVLIDGANPLPEPFLTEADLPGFRAMAEGMAHAFEQVESTDRRILLTPQDFVDLNVEVDAVRSDILDRYRKLHCPISVIASTAMAGDGDDERTRWRNQNWRDGFERLARERPQTPVTWLDAGHDLVLTHASPIAEIIRGTQDANARAAS
jgi:esterase